MPEWAYVVQHKELFTRASFQRKGLLIDYYGENCLSLTKDNA